MGKFLIEKKKHFRKITRKLTCAGIKWWTYHWTDIIATFLCTGEQPTMYLRGDGKIYPLETDKSSGVERPTLFSLNYLWVHQQKCDLIFYS